MNCPCANNDAICCCQKLLAGLKMNSAKMANLILQKTGQRFWQRNYYGHIIRNKNELNRIRGYITYNPMNWQFDRGNPGYIEDKDYDRKWRRIENMIYGKKSTRRGSPMCFP